MNSVERNLLKYEPIKTFYPFAFKLARNDEQARELICHCTLKALEKAHLYQEGNFKSWFIQILRNEFINLHRRAKRTTYLNESILNVPEEENIQKERQETVKGFIKTLPPKQKQTLILYRRGFVFREIALIMDTNISNVKSRMRLSREKLKQAI